LPQQRRDGPFVIARERPTSGQTRAATAAAAAARPCPRSAPLLLLLLTARRVRTGYRVHRRVVRRPLPRLVIDRRGFVASAARLLVTDVHRGHVPPPTVVRPPATVQPPFIIDGGPPATRRSARPIYLRTGGTVG